MPSVRNAISVLLALHTVLTVAFLPLVPPTAAMTGGWVVGGAVVLLSAGASAWVLRGGTGVTFNRLLGLAYLGLVAPMALQLLSGQSLPYQLLYLVWVGAGSVQPARRAFAYLAALAVASLLPFLLGQVSGDLTEAIAWTVLFTALGLVLTVYVSYVRRQRLELRTGERHARALASAATQRVRDLQWVTDATLVHLPLEELLDSLLGRIVEAMGVDHGAVLLYDERGTHLRQSASSGTVPDDLLPGAAVSASFPSKVVGERRPVTIRELQSDGPLEDFLLQAGFTSVLGVPLLSGETVLGVLFVATSGLRRFLDDDASFLQLVGDRVALAAERSRLFESQRHIAATLQRSLLPGALPTIPDVEIAVRYLPGGAGIDVGGDWYDVIDLRDGQIALAIGDVVGRGLAAATLMGRLRTALQAYALEDHEPAAVLERLHRLLEEQADDAIATVLYLVLNPAEGTAVIANAGHLPPLLRKPDGTTRYLMGPKSPPLGALPYARYEQYSVTIGREFTLMLFTDGLVEQRGSSLSERLEELRQAVCGSPPRPEALCDAAISALLGRHDFNEHPLGDDVALIALMLEPLPEEGFSLDLPAEPEVLATLRAAIDRWLRTTEADERDAYAIKAATVEACANAIEHAYRPGDAALRIEGNCSEDEVSLTVRDFGEWRDQRGEERGRGIFLMKRLMDFADVEPSEQGTTVRLSRRLGDSRSL